MNRPLIFRKAMDVLDLSSPVSNFPEFVLYSEYAGLPSSDAALLRCIHDCSGSLLSHAILTSDDSDFDSSCASISSSIGGDFDKIHEIIDDIRYSLTLAPGSSDEIPLAFSSSGLLFSTSGCIKGEISVSGCELFDTCVVVPEHVMNGIARFHVTSIAPMAFSGKTHIRSIILPASIRDIGYRAFFGCSGMDDFILPSSVRKIGFRAFEGCSSLSSIAVSPKNPFFRTFPNGILCSVHPFEVIRAPYCLSGTVTIPEGVTCIGSESFEGCSRMTEVLLPDGVGSVMYRAFLGCSSLSLASIPDSARIGFHAFPDSVEREMRHV